MRSDVLALTNFDDEHDGQLALGTMASGEELVDRREIAWPQEFMGAQRMMTRANWGVVLCLTALTVSAALGCGDDEGVSRQLQAITALSEPPGQLIDSQGLAWARGGKVQISHVPKPKDTAIQSDAVSVPDLSRMELDAIARDFTPVMRSRGYEYHLLQQDQIAFARDLQQRIRSVPTSAPASDLGDPFQVDDMRGETRLFF